jgi:RimJ/RimL family protein N-acetyltransferase
MNLNLESSTIFFRTVSVNDAEFILKLRTNENYSKHLSKTENDLQRQINWIKEFKKREEIGQEYYFIVCLKSNSLPIGTVRMYDFLEVQNSFCWGSWILNENKTRYAAIECALLIYDFAFDKLKFDFCHMDIRKENHKVIDFHKRMGVQIIGETELDFLGSYNKEVYLKIRPSLLELVVY